LHVRNRHDTPARSASVRAQSGPRSTIYLQCHSRSRSTARPIGPNRPCGPLSRSRPGSYSRLLILATLLLAACAIAWPAASQTTESESDEFDFDFDAYETEGDEEEEDDEEIEEELDAEDLELEAQWGEIEELTVTGKAGQALEVDAAESTVQFDSAELDAMGVADIADIGNITPNLEIRRGDATQANFFIRGVGLADFSANSSSAVAIFQDGVPLNSAAIQLVGLFDTAGVSVERGPQGAGSARNATAGAIRIDSALPTGELTAK